jgi:hypothetical protein
MGRRGWWQQVKNNDYPEPSKSYGQDIDALDPRRLEKKTESSSDSQPIEAKKTKKSISPSKLLPSSPPVTSSQHETLVRPLRCRSCGHEKSLTPEAVDEIRKRLVIEISFRDMAPLRDNLHRLKCSNCGAKAAQLTSHDPPS